MRILVTGAGGMLGGDLCDVLGHSHSLIRKPFNEMDVRNKESVFATLGQSTPDVVVHLGALTDVDKCEQHPDEAYLTNFVGTHNVALACAEFNIILVYVSSISVFGGHKEEPYTEFDPIQPINHYARSKHAGEKIVENLLRKYYIVRAGWMFSGNAADKKFVAKIISLARTRDRLEIVNDKFGSPTYTLDFANGIANLLATGCYGTYNMVGNGSYCSRYEFARAILEYADIHTCHLVPVSSEKFPLAAPRPRMEAAYNYSLKLHGFDWMRPWRDGLRDCLHSRSGELIRDK